MHASSFENMQKCFDRYVRPALAPTATPQLVVDVGAHRHGSYRPIFSGNWFHYVGVDVLAGPGVDIVVDGRYRLPLTDECADVVMSREVLAPFSYREASFNEMVRVLKPDGLLFLIAPSAGPARRVLPDALDALAKFAACHLVDRWVDERGPDHDVVGVFSKEPHRSRPIPAEAGGAPDRRDRTWEQLPSVPEFEVTAGQRGIYDVLWELHTLVTPRLYLEIGVDRGRSLSLARGRAIGVDPDFQAGVVAAPGHTLYRKTSDRFFDEDAVVALAEKVDLAYIDGLHLFEFALRDFMNVERHAHRRTVVLVDDIFPNHPMQARRIRRTGNWTGDVWKLMECLRQFRPDLRLTAFDTYPTGLLTVTGVDPENRVLWEAYNDIVATFRDHAGDAVPVSVLRRDGAVPPTAPILKGAVMVADAQASNGPG